MVWLEAGQISFTVNIMVYETGISAVMVWENLSDNLFLLLDKWNSSNRCYL